MFDNKIFSRFIKARTKNQHLQLEMLHLAILFSLLFIFVESFIPSFKDCNFTDLRFQSKYSLGKQDELNNTFDSLGPKVKIPDITYTVNSYTNYSLVNFTSALQYIDSRQKAQILGNDTILIDGGYLLATVDMKWSRKDFMQRGGSLQVICKSQQIIFTKNLTIQGGYLIYQVSDYMNVSFDSECKLTRYDPANISDLDLGYLKQLINQRDDKKETAKQSLIKEISQRFYLELNNSLYNQKHQLDDKFVYTWTNARGQSMNIEYQVLPTGVDLQKAGLSFTFVTEIRDYDRWECGVTIPHQNLDVKTFGGIQEFLSLSVFKNTLKYGIQQGALDTVLNKKAWSSKMFQFYAGDLYEVIPSISSKYIASEQITGKCKASPQNITITPEYKINELCAKTTHTCQLFIKGTTNIVDIKVSLYTFIEARFQQEAKVNFYIKDFTHSISYIEKSDFKIADYSLANAIVYNTLANIIEIKTFGSGWPTFKMDLPQMKVMSEGYVVLYDTSHIGRSVQAESYKEKDL